MARRSRTRPPTGTSCPTCGWSTRRAGRLWPSRCSRRRRGRSSRKRTLHLLPLLLGYFYFLKKHEQVRGAGCWSRGRRAPTPPALALAPAFGAGAVARFARADWNRRRFVIVGLLAALSVKEADDDEPDDCVSPREAYCVSSRLRAARFGARASDYRFGTS